MPKKKPSTTAAPRRDDPPEAKYDPPRRSYFLNLNYDDGGYGRSWGPDAATRAEIERLAQFVARIVPGVYVETCQSDEPGGNTSVLGVYSRPGEDDDGIRDRRYHILHGGRRVSAENDRRIAELRLRCLAVVEGTNQWRLYDAATEQIVVDLKTEAEQGE